MKGNDLAKRAKKLLKRWQGLVAHLSNVSVNSPFSRANTPESRAGTPTLNGLLRKNELLERPKSCTPDLGQPHGNGQPPGKKRKHPSSSSESSPPPPKIAPNSPGLKKMAPSSPGLKKIAPSSPGLKKITPSSPGLKSTKNRQGNGSIKSKKGVGGRRSSKSASPLTVTEQMDGEVKITGAASPLAVSDVSLERIPSLDAERVDSGTSIDSGFGTESSPVTNGFLKSPQPTADVYLPSDTRIQEDRISPDSCLSADTDSLQPGQPVECEMQTDSNKVTEYPFVPRVPPVISEPCLPPTDIPEEDLVVHRRELPSNMLAPQSEADGVNGTYNEEGVWTDWSANVSQRKGELLILPYVILE